MSALPQGSPRIRNAIALTLLATLAGCASQGPSYRATLNLTPGRYYPPPGPPSDPWGPYIRQAAARFSVPEQWIRAVMRQESAGAADALSPAGAIGLMQVMPATYSGLEYRYSLGNDPWEPHDNIMAGTAYIKEMYDRFGSPGFLAAYNAGPGRVDDYLSSGNPLPTETVNYVASIAPHLGGSGPTALPTYAVARQPTPGTCDPDAAYDPSHPCAPAVIYASAMAPVAAAPPQPTPQYCDLDAAYDPTRPCAPAPVVLASAEPPPPQFPPSVLHNPAPPPPPRFQYASLPVAPPPAVISGGFASGGDWAVQVGAFATPATARTAASSARGAVPPARRIARRGFYHRAIRQHGSLPGALDQPLGRAGSACVFGAGRCANAVPADPAEQRISLQIRRR